MKRKLPPTASPAAEIPANKRLRSILKSTEFPRSPNRSVCFQPAINVGEILAKMVDGKLEAGQLETILSELEASRGPALVIWLQGLTEHVHTLDSELQSLVEQILQLSWTDQSQEVVSAYQRFLISLLSAHPVYNRAVIRSLLKKFSPSETGRKDEQNQVQELSPSTLNVHSVLKDILKLSKEGRTQLVEQLNQTFPFFKHSPSKLIPFTRAATAIAQYIGPGGQTAVMEILLEKVIKLDASLTRQDITSYLEDEGRSEKVVDPLIARLVVSLDLSMAALFELVHAEAGYGDQKDGHGHSEKAASFTELMLQLFQTHILPTHKIFHLQYLIFYLAGRDRETSKKFLQRLWGLFTSFTTASILRQAAISYLAGYLCRALAVKTKTLAKYLKKIVKWIHNYLGQDRTLCVDYMHVNLAAHGPFYSACQAACYVVAFRHVELVPEDDLTFLRSLQLSSIVSHQLNPLRVMQTAVVKEFSKVVSHYQLAYCKTVLERNRRITLPVVGLSSTSTAVAKPLLLDNYFPFDPYNLPGTRHWVQPYYRPHQQSVLDYDSDSSSDGENDEVGESGEEADEEVEGEGAASEEELPPALESLLLKARSRSVSVSSNASASSLSRRRSRKASMSEVLLHEIPNL